MPLPEDETSWANLDVMFATTRGTVRRNKLSDFVDVWPGRRWPFRCRRRQSSCRGAGAGFLRVRSLVDAQGDAEIELGGGALVAGLALHLLDGRFEHGGIKLEPDRLDVAALFAAEHVAGAAEFEIEGGNLEAGAEVGELLERGQAAAGNLGELLLRRDEQIGVGAAIGTADAAAQLVEFAEPVAIGSVDQHGIGERDVEAVFDDGGGDQHIVLVVHEGQHDALELGFAHLAVADDDARAGHQFLDARGDLVDGFDAVVDEVDLAAAFEFELDRRANDLFIELGNHGLNGHAVFGRGLDHRHVAQADQRHVQGARDGRGRHGEHVDLFAELLEALFVAHAEALLFIDDEQAEVLELDVFGQQAVGADQDVDLAGLDAAPR